MRHPKPRPFVQIRRLCSHCGEHVPVRGLTLCRPCLEEFDFDALDDAADPDLKAGAGDVFDDLTAEFYGVMVLEEPDPVGDSR